MVEEGSHNEGESNRDREDKGEFDHGTRYCQQDKERQAREDEGNDAIEVLLHVASVAIAVDAIVDDDQHRNRCAHRRIPCWLRGRPEWRTTAFATFLLRSHLRGPFSIAAQKQIPLVDADGMGRAFPRLEMVTFTLHDIPVSPITQADEKGNKNVYHTINNEWGETLVGATAIQMGGSCAIGCYPMSGAQVKKAAVHGIVSYAQILGEAILNTKEQNLNPLDSLMEKAEAIKLFTGKISNVTIKTEGRWNKGVCEIMGLDENQGSSMELDFQNEFLMAKTDGKPLAITPDLIVLIDAENAQPITAETIQYGTRVIVLGMKANEQWRTPKGIELGGPKKFGYKEKYVPVEELNKKQ